MKLKGCLLLACFSLVGMAQAKLIKKTVEYREGSTTLEGYLVYNDSVNKLHPAVVVIPDWMGVSNFYHGIADKMAQMGYTALVADIYGKGVRPKDTQEASEMAGRYKSNRQLLRSRGQAAFDRVLQEQLIDTNHVAVIGYCFGGTAALELARSGAPLAGVVSFHGGLDTPTPGDASSIKGKILALTGADDPYVPPEQVQDFEKEMNNGHVNWELVRYSGAVHAFTNPAAGNDNSKGAAYNKQADVRSWQAMRNFFGEIFK